MGNLFGKYYKVMYDYDPRTFKDLKVRKGDRLWISNNKGQWLKAKKMGTNESGYVPINYIALEGTLQAEDWFFESTTRKEAERQLLHESNIDGSFLVRRAESQDRPPNEFSLSVLWHGSVKHFKIMVAKNGHYYLSHLFKKYATLTDLIEHSIRQPMWDQTRILHPCFRSVKPVVPGLGSNQWEIRKTTLTKVKILGTGNFGEVWHGKWEKKIDVAVKEMNPNTMKKADFIEESEILKKMNHPKLVQLLAVSTKEDPIYIVTELLENGSLKSYLEARYRDKNPVEITIMVYMATQVAQGMSYLEKNGYIHRDLAARNVLVGKDNVCKVADFGLAKCLDEEVYNTFGGQFPLRWTAPEALHKRVFSIKSDVWSFGILLTEIVTHGMRVPYQGLNVGNSIASLLNFLVEEGARIPLDHLPGCPPYLYDVMMQCWHEDPVERPGFFKLHDILDAYDSSCFYSGTGAPGDGAGAHEGVRYQYQD